MLSFGESITLSYDEFKNWVGALGFFMTEAELSLLTTQKT